ncbi:hypothetical protein [Streptomyces sp. NPDC054784]
MISPDTARFWWRAVPKERPKGAGWRAVDESDFREREDRVTGPQSLTGPVPGWADDLLRTARAAFLADRLVRRPADGPPDGSGAEPGGAAVEAGGSGTAEGEQGGAARHFTVSVPVTDPDRWETAAGPLLSPLLGALTGDVWTLEFRQLPQRPTQALLPGDDTRRAREVAVFSGGLDSLGWAAQRAADTRRGPLLLVAFAERKPGKWARQPAYDAVRALGGRLVRLLTVPGQTPRAHGNTLERTASSRGLLYAALAVRAAAAEDVPVLHAPENGQLALGTPAFGQPPSIVHPWPLHLLNGVVTAVAGTVRVKNPLLYDTCGQVCRAALAAGLDRDALERTVSCAAAPARRPGPEVVNCGLCQGCLVRRAGLLHANGADTTPYGSAPWLLPPDHRDAGAWRALEPWLERPEFTGDDLVARLPLPPRTHAEPLLEVVEQGREELRALVRAAPRVVGSA